MISFRYMGDTMGYDYMKGGKYLWLDEDAP